SGLHHTAECKIRFSTTSNLCITFQKPKFCCLNLGNCGVRNKRIKHLSIAFKVDSLFTVIHVLLLQHSGMTDLQLWGNSMVDGDLASLLAALSDSKTA